MRATELQFVIQSLQRLRGSNLHGVWQPARDRFILGFNGQEFLLLKPSGQLPRVHTLSTRPANPGQPFSFQGACRAWLRGPLSRIEHLAPERIVILQFAKGTLHLRLTGRSGGLWLLNGQKVIASLTGPAPEELAPLPPPPNTIPTENRFRPRQDEDWDLAARRWFNTKEASLLLTQRKRTLEVGLKREQKRTARLINALHRDLGKAEEEPKVRAHADALSIHLHTLKDRIGFIRLPDPLNPEQLLEITLDPARSPTENVQRMYARARRLARMGDRVLENLERAEGRQRKILTALLELKEADLSDLGGLEALIPKQSRGVKHSVKAYAWHAWTGPNDERVLVGKHAKGNRKLTFQLGKGHDFWMHIRGVPGPHVLIPVGKNQVPNLDLLLAAAQIALHHQRVEPGAHVDIQYTKVRHVRSIPGDNHGRVLISHEKVLHVTCDPSLLVGWSRKTD